MLERVESALTRLEAMAGRPEKQSAPVPDLAPRLAELEASNARLRAAVSTSIQQIDVLIARQKAEVQR